VSLLSNISLSGSLDFGEKFLKSSTKKSLTISNKLNVPVTITSIVLPSGFESNWSGGSIPASGSREVEITFNPVDPKDYSGTIVVKNNIDESIATINVTAIGIGGISLLGDLDFGKVEIGKTVEKFFIIKNESSSIMEISFITMPIGYTSNWRANGNIILNPNTGTTISIVFKPTEALVYNGFIDVINSVDNSSNSRTSIKGEGISGIDLVIGIWKLVKSYVFDQGAWEEIVYESCKLLDRSIFEENGVWKYTEFSNIDGVCIQDMDNGFINGSWKKNSDGSYQIKLKYIEEGEFTETWIISFPTSNTMKVIYNVNNSDYTLFSRVE
ncbi:MAG: choice-of-anchor D domain-containing protein, partial [Lutibacter sp.]|nr:choice-of-anchor D domain-containing protein [Lutibacter sp.]